MKGLGLALALALVFYALAGAFQRLEPPRFWTPPPVLVEDEPRVAEGIYTRDAWGVGRFSFMLVGPHLHERLAPFEGRRIRLSYGHTVHTWNQRVDMFNEIVAIEELPHVPLKLHVRPGLIQLENRGTSPLQVRSVHVYLHQPWPDPSEETAFFFQPYLRSQMSMAMKSGGAGPHPFVLFDAPGADQLSSGDHLRIEPGERFPLAVDIQGPARQISVSVMDEERRILAEAWVPFEAPSPPFQPRVLEKRFKRERDGWRELTLKLDGLPRVVGRGDEPAVRLQMSGECEGTSFSFEPRRGPWSLIPSERPLKLRFQVVGPVDTLTLHLVSERGLERVVLTDLPSWAD